VALALKSSLYPRDLLLELFRQDFLGERPQEKMSDIFISYAREDRDMAKTLAELFQQQERSVWWDRSIPPGRSFDEMIEEALGAAKCVVVLWSKKFGIIRLGQRRSGRRVAPENSGSGAH
jgi:hypothetical protein